MLISLDKNNPFLRPWEEYNGLIIKRKLQQEKYCTFKIILISPSLTSSPNFHWNRQLGCLCCVQHKSGAVAALPWGKEKYFPFWNAATSVGLLESALLKLVAQLRAGQSPLGLLSIAQVWDLDTAQVVCPSLASLPCPKTPLTCLFPASWAGLPNSPGVSEVLCITFATLLGQWKRLVSAQVESLDCAVNVFIRTSELNWSTQLPILL